MFVMVYARLYGRALVDALGSIGRNAWTLVLPIALVVGFLLVGGLLSGLGFVGGFLLGLLQAVVSSVYLYFLEQLVGKNRASVAEFKKSAGAYFVNCLSFAFIIWVVGLGLDVLTANSDNQEALQNVASVVLLLALNAAPETIYLRGTRSGVDTVMRSFQFLQENWVEWLIPNGLVVGAGVLLAPWLFLLPGGAMVSAVFLGALLHVAMVFRGFLYEALDTSTHRQRMFKYRGHL